MLVPVLEENIGPFKTAADRTDIQLVASSDLTR
jgi:hypothetical protein